MRPPRRNVDTRHVSPSAHADLNTKMTMSARLCWSSSGLFDVCPGQVHQRSVQAKPFTLSSNGRARHIAYLQTRHNWPFCTAEIERRNDAQPC